MSRPLGVALGVYTEGEVRQRVQADSARLFSSYTVGRPKGWATDDRTKELVCLSIWLREELLARGVDGEARIRQEWLFNRKSRAEENLFELAARIMNDTIDGKLDAYRGRL